MRTIGPYDVVRELGRGGMGAVYEGVDPTLGRRVALKVVLEVAADPDALVRFEREAQLLARVQHPGVVRVHALERAGRSPVLVTELIEGARPLEPGPLPPRDAARIVRDLADAVEAVHQTGVLHRDLKPGNVVRRADGSLVLLDFGVARELDGSSLTRTGEVVGTPAFMAPEQVEGRRDIDARADVYGLGALLLQLLVGRPPFSGGLVQVLAAVLDRDPPWPGDVAGAPAALDRIVRRAMAKRRDERPPTAAALRDELDAWLAAPETAPGRSHRLLAATAAVAALLVTVVVAVTRPAAPTVAPTNARTPSPPIGVIDSSQDRPEATSGAARPDPVAQLLAAARAGEVSPALREAPWINVEVPTAYRGPHRSIRAAFVDDRRLVVAGVAARRAAVATIVDREQLAWTELPELPQAGPIRRAVPIADGLAIAGHGGLIITDRSARLRRQLVTGAFVAEVVRAEIEPGRTRLLYLTEGREVFFVDTDDGTPQRLTHVATPGDIELALSPDGGVALLLVKAREGGRVVAPRFLGFRLPEAAGSPPTELSIGIPERRPAWALAFLPDGSVVLGLQGMSLGRSRLDGSGFQVSSPPPWGGGLRPNVSRVAASPRATTLYGASDAVGGGNVLIAWVPGADPLRCAPRGPEVRSLDVSPDGLFVAVGADDARLEVWVAGDDLP